MTSWDDGERLEVKYPRSKRNLFLQLSEATRATTRMRESEGNASDQPMKGIQGGRLEEIVGEHFLKTKLKEDCFVWDPSPPYLIHRDTAIRDFFNISHGCLSSDFRCLHLLFLDLPACLVCFSILHTSEVCNLNSCK